MDFQTAAPFEYVTNNSESAGYHSSGHSRDEFPPHQSQMSGFRLQDNPYSPYFYGAGNGEHPQFPPIHTCYNQSFTSQMSMTEIQLPYHHTLSESIAHNHIGSPPTLNYQAINDSYAFQGQLQNQKRLSFPDHPERRVRRRPRKDPQAAPSVKRQRIRDSGYGNHDFDAAFDGICRPSCTYPPSIISECCSSCSGGEPCAEPDCEIQKDVVIPCTNQSCDQSFCPDDKCPEIDIQKRLPIDPHESVRSSARLASWLDNTWGPQGSGAPRSRDEKNTNMDPRITDEVQNLRNSCSAAPTTPSIANDLETPFSSGEFSTPQITSNASHHSNIDSSVLSGAGTLFDSETGGWLDTTFDTSNTGNISFPFNCAWTGCEQPLYNQFELLQHMHNTHVDPQMTFYCPLQTDGCPPQLDSNPLEHMRAFHGYTLDNDTKANCPSVSCPPDQLFNLAMLHKHIDQEHTANNLGSLHCDWNSCNTNFPSSTQFLSHLEEHFPSLETQKGSSIRHEINPSSVDQYPTTIPDDEIPVKEDEHRCRWKMVNSNFCDKVFTSPKELQEHLKEHHLKILNKKTGYYCQWDGCKRGTKPGKPDSFTQRGKLERHMASHTNFKIATCIQCGESFSAQQALDQHMRLHTGEKPFKCKHCGKDFPQQSACTIHERTHTKEKPLKCDMCDKCFSESSNLAKHRKTHGEKGIHACDIPGCGKSFHRLDQLKRHKTMHSRKGVNGSPGSASGSARADSEEPTPSHVFKAVDESYDAN